MNKPDAHQSMTPNNPVRNPIHKPTLLKLEVLNWNDEGGGQWIPNEVLLVYRNGSWHRKLGAGPWVNMGLGLDAIDQAVHASTKLAEHPTQGSNQPEIPEEQVIRSCMLPGKGTDLDTFYLAGESVCRDGFWLTCEITGEWSRGKECRESRNPMSPPMKGPGRPNGGSHGMPNE